MQRMFSRVLGTLGLLGVTAVGSPALAQVVQGEGGEPGAQCFYCDDGAPCQPSQHYDTGSFVWGTRQGAFHPTCELFSCDEWKGKNGHELYLYDEENLLLVAVNVMRDGRDEVISRFLLEHPEVRLNVARGALQVATLHGDVFFHARLKAAQVQRLVVAVTTPSAATATARSAPGSGPRTPKK